LLPEAHTLLATSDGVASLPIDAQVLQVIAVRRSNMKNQQVLLYTAQP
jgi:hypothetical protein